MDFDSYSRAMGGGGCPEGSSKSGSGLSESSNGSAWSSWSGGGGGQPHRQMRGSFHPGVGAGARHSYPYMRGGANPVFFPGYRGFGFPPQASHFTQEESWYNLPNVRQGAWAKIASGSKRKPRPQWNMRNPRPPQYSSLSSSEKCLSYQQPNWPGQQAQPQAEEQLHCDEPPPKKKKRSTNGTSRPWDREAAERALAMESECQKNAGSNAIVIRFPDPELSKEIVQNLHPSIENVHFQAPCGARYCFVTLAEDTNVDKVMAEIKKVKFGVGHLIAERKVQKAEENVGPENIDPFTLYVGNLPTNISTIEVKEKFPTATRIDVGYAQKMKYTRYAFVRYSTAEAALEAYKASVNSVIASRSIILRFRRHKAPVGPPGEKPAPSAIETKPGEKLTIGAKLKAKREKAKAEKAIRDAKTKKKKVKGEGEEGSSDDEEVELENDDTDSEEVTEEEEDDDDDEDDDEPEDDEEEEDDDDEDDIDQLEDDDPDDDDDDDPPNDPDDDDDDYMDDDDDYKDVI